MGKLAYEFIEAIRIAAAQIRANKMRSALTALGVIIGIVAVTLMGTAIKGINVGFDRSLSMLGDDVIYVQKWPWHNVEDWWNYANRPFLTVQNAKDLNQLIAANSHSELEVAVFADVRNSTVKAGGASVSGVFTRGTNADYGRVVTTDFEEGRLFSETESEGARQVCVLGYDVAHALFPGHSAMGQKITVQGQPFEVIGILAKQGSFLGLFSFDNQMLMPLGAYRKYFGIQDQNTELQVKIRDKNRLAESEDELEGAMRRVRALEPGVRDNFSLNEGQAFKQQLDPIKQGIAFAGLFVTGLSLFVGAIGIMNITFVSVRERTKEIGTRKALGARRRTILLQFLIEAVSICAVGGCCGLALTYVLCVLVQTALPSFPLVFSGSLVLTSMLVAVMTGVVSGFVPALGASRLDPVVALRYE
jgi:putative ABC transport system permease protein